MQSRSCRKVAPTAQAGSGSAFHPNITFLAFGSDEKAELNTT